MAQSCFFVTVFNAPYYVETFVIIAVDVSRTLTIFGRFIGVYTNPCSKSPAARSKFTISLWRWREGENGYKGYKSGCFFLKCSIHAALQPGGVLDEKFIFLQFIGLAPHAVYIFAAAAAALRRSSRLMLQNVNVELFATATCCYKAACQV